jgi:hypothetical protein
VTFGRLLAGTAVLAVAVAVGTGTSTLALTGSQPLLGTMQLAVALPLFTSGPGRFPLLPTLAVVALGALGTGLAVLEHPGGRPGGPRGRGPHPEPGPWVGRRTPSRGTAQP